ncbi:MAG: SDR family oxidoreductase [Verrucomicrobia bacterium]|nr:SDR family oxidoreductase [Verrucomicrobiota bacterium]MBI3868386.1 SDR family oxidoreductase [Verrucomicrobiota bacterium]
MNLLGFAQENRYEVPTNQVAEANRQPVVLLTGASSGIGLALSRRLLKEPCRLILTARESSLPRFAAAGIHESDRIAILPLDVTRLEERKATIEEANRRWDGVDVLINNAGVAFRAVCEHVTEADRVEQLNVNYHGPMGLIRLTLPRMRERRSGRIINISSVGGMMAMPTMALYSASKFALEGATESLWYEVRPFGIQVTLVQPGFIRSDSFKNTRYSALSRSAAENPGDPYRAHYLHMSRFIERYMGRARTTPDDVARHVIKIMRSRRPPLRSGATSDAHLFAWLRRLLPRGLYHEALYRCLPGIREWGPPRD